MSQRCARKAIVKGPKNACRSGGVRSVAEGTSSKLSSTVPVVSQLHAIISGVAEDCGSLTIPSSNKKDESMVHRLATILHGCFLITMAGKAQLRVGQISHCVTATVDERWLEAITRYCGFTVVPQDVVECGVAFPEWLCTVETVVNRVSSTGVSCEAGTVPVVKVKLIRSLVPSIAEAQGFLMERWGSSGSWRDAPSETNLSLRCPPCAGKDRPVPPAQCSEAMKVDDDRDAGGGVESKEGNMSDEELLKQLSAELKASLSRERLAEVLAQMRREALGLEAKEEELINRRQRHERLLSTYDLVRVLLGEKRSSCNVSHLVQQMVEQNRFGDGKEGVVEQLVCLTEFRESGVAIFQMDEDISAGESGCSAGTKTVPETSSVCLKPAKVDVNSSLKEMECFVLRLDRTLASRVSLHEALQQEQPH